MIPDWKLPVYANQLRESVSLGLGDLIPDIDDIVAKTGYKYVEESFGDDFSGMSKSLGGGDYLIAFNKDHNWSEQFRRFTISHEFGHVTIPHHRILLDKQILHRSRPEYNSKDAIEIEADKFAINFLAPRNIFLEIAGSDQFNPDTILKLSEHFNISTYATALRFIDLTDLSCSLIVNRTDGMIAYERRSKKFSEGFSHSFLYRQKIPRATLTYDFINKNSNDFESVVELNDWYPDLPKIVNASESVIELGYNDYILTLLDPHESSIDLD